MKIRTSIWESLALVAPLALVSFAGCEAASNSAAASATAESASAVSTTAVSSDATAPAADCELKIKRTYDLSAAGANLAADFSAKTVPVSIEVESNTCTDSGGSATTAPAKSRTAFRVYRASDVVSFREHPGLADAYTVDGSGTLSALSREICSPRGEKIVVDLVSGMVDATNNQIVVEENLTLTPKSDDCPQGGFAGKGGHHRHGHGSGHGGFFAAWRNR